MKAKALFVTAAVTALCAYLIIAKLLRLTENEFETERYKCTVVRRSFGRIVELDTREKLELSLPCGGAAKNTNVYVSQEKIFFAFEDACYSLRNLVSRLMRTSDSRHVRSLQQESWHDSGKGWESRIIKIHGVERDLYVEMPKIGNLTSRVDVVCSVAPEVYMLWGKASSATNTPPTK